MNKNFTINLIFVFGLLLLASNCTTNEDNLEGDSENKTIHIEERFALIPPNFDTLLLSSKTEFNRQGKPIEKFQYSRFDYSMIIHTKWTYDEHDNLINKTTDNKEAGKIFKENYTYEYDNKGRKVKMMEYNSDNPEGIEHNYFYNNDGTYIDSVRSNSQIVLVMKYNENDKIIHGNNFQQKSKIENEFDEYGNYISRRNIYEDGPPVFITYTNDYDSIGNLIRKKLDHRYREYEYNENGDVIKETRFDGDKTMLIFQNKYEYFE